MGSMRSGELLNALTGDDTDYAYTYTSAEGLHAILETGVLHLGTFDSLNDPRENKQWVAREMLSPEGVTDEGWYRRSGEIVDHVDVLLRRSARIACFTKTRSVSGQPSARGWARPAMWAHYGRAHTGACLIFNSSRIYELVHEAAPLFAQPVRSFAGDVVYRDGPLFVPIYGAPASLDELWQQTEQMLDAPREPGERSNLERLYLTKNRDWRYEAEWRLITLHQNLPAPVIDEPLAVKFGDALVGIVLGERYGSREDADRLRDDVPAFTCTWEDGVPSLIQ